MLLTRKQPPGPSGSVAGGGVDITTVRRAWWWIMRVAVCLLRQATGGNPCAQACAAALLGFLVVGLFDSLLDVPRIALLCYLMLLCALLQPPQPPPPESTPP